MAELTEAEAVAEIAGERAKHETIADGYSTLIVPSGSLVKEYDIERFLPAPSRARGTVVVHNAASFAQAVEQRTGTSVDFKPAVYADEENAHLVAILNDDSADGAGWRDLRVELALRSTPEWDHWLNGSNRLMPQTKFAEHVEAGRLELVDPTPGVMLDLAQNFQATTSARFRGGSRLADGRRQFTWEETQDATAGESGQIVIPDTITLGVTPFFGSSRFEVTGLFRYRLDRGELTLGYILDRPHLVVAAAFNQIRSDVAELLSITPIAGVAPARGGRA